MATPNVNRDLIAYGLGELDYPTVADLYNAYQVPNVSDAERALITDVTKPFYDNWIASNNQRAATRESINAQIDDANRKLNPFGVSVNWGGNSIDAQGRRALVVFGGSYYKEYSADYPIQQAVNDYFASRSTVTNNPTLPLNLNVGLSPTVVSNLTPTVTSTASQTTIAGSIGTSTPNANTSVNFTNPSSGQYSIRANGSQQPNQQVSTSGPISNDTPIPYKDYLLYAAIGLSLFALMKGFKN